MFILKIHSQRNNLSSDDVSEPELSSFDYNLIIDIIIIIIIVIIIVIIVIIIIIIIIIIIVIIIQYLFIWY